MAASRTSGRFYRQSAPSRQFVCVSSETLPYSKTKSRRCRETGGSWLDEIQRVPKLLDEVHFLIEEKGYRHFALTGSSARKLKRGTANLLAGRAVVRNMFPLTSRETRFSIPAVQLLRFGSMPLSVNAPNDENRGGLLTSYVTTYLSEEIKAEGLVRHLGSFSRFLDVAALAAGQRVNVSNIARDAGVSRETARGFFEGSRRHSYWKLAAGLPSARENQGSCAGEVLLVRCGSSPRRCRGFDQPMPSDWGGILLEHHIHHELRSHMHYAAVKGTLGYWATPSGSEVDFVWWRGIVWSPSR